MRVLVACEFSGTVRRRLSKSEIIARRKDFCRNNTGNLLLPRLPALWVGCSGELRVGKSGDVVTMLDDLKIPSVSP